MFAFHKISVSFIFLLLLTACGSAGSSTTEIDNAEVIKQAVQETVAAMPTQPPVIVEVTRIVDAAAVDVTAVDASASDNQTGDSTDAGEAPAVDTPEPAAGCPATSERQFALISMDGVDLNHPDSQHSDLNLSLRGSEPTDAALEFVELGNLDPDAPQLSGMFADGRRVTLTSASQVYDWDWTCGEHGCPGALLSKYDATLVGLATVAGEELRVPSRGGQIDGEGYIAAVLYADPTQITLSYARAGTVADGYTIHLENICIDPNLLALYQSANANGRGDLPALKNDVVLGSARGDEMRAAVRVRGTFLDPRSRGDWWKSY